MSDAICPDLGPRGVRCERWNQPAAHAIDGMHQAGSVRWPYGGRPTLGSLFSGAGMLDLAVADALGARTVWVADTDDAASLVLAERLPGVPNHKDVRTLTADPVDILAGGYPCQGESNAGKRLGDADPRWMWPAYRDLIATMRPKLAIGENVRAHLGRSFRHVVADLLSLGYAVVWGVVAASDVGACHERKRLWWLAWPQEYGPPVGLGAVPFAHLEAGVMVVDDLFGGAPATDWPVAGAADEGAAYAAPAFTGAAPGGELLKTPTAQLAINGGSQPPAKRAAGGHGPTLADQVEHLLPTPSAGAFNDGEDVDQWEARRARPAERGINGNGMGTPLTIAVQLLPTTTATDARGGSTRLTHQGGNLTLLGALMPTPRATDGAKGGPNQRGSSGDLTLPSAVQPERFGPYAAAVARWEALTRPAPDPTVTDWEPYRRALARRRRDARPVGMRGALPSRPKPRLSPAFAEWLMGLAAGHITDVRGLSRADMLRLAGNGVVRQQGAAAVAWLARRLPAALRAELSLTDAATGAAPAHDEEGILMQRIPTGPHPPDTHPVGAGGDALPRKAAR